MNFHLHHLLGAEHASVYRCRFQPRQGAAWRGTPGHKNGPGANEGGPRPPPPSKLWLFAPGRVPSERRPPPPSDVRGRAAPLSLPAAGMPKLSKEAKQRLQQLFKGGQFAIRWGFIPVVLYLGFRRGADPGMPEPTIWSLLWGWKMWLSCSRTSRWTEKVFEDAYLPKDEANTYTSWLCQLADDIGCTYNKMEFIWT